MITTWVWSMLLVFCANSSYADPVDATDQAELNLKMAEAQAQLEEAAEKIAELSRQMSKSDTFTIMKSISPFNRRVMLGVKIDQPRDGSAGVLVREVVAGGPAAAAGIKQGDLIVAIDRLDLTSGDGADSIEMMLDAIRQLEPGDEIDVALERDDQSISKQVVVESVEKTLPRFQKSYGSEHALVGEKLSEMLSNLELGNLPFDIDIDLDADDFQELRRLPKLLEEQLSDSNGSSIITLLGRHAGFMPEFQLAAVDAELGAYFGVENGALLTTKPADESLGLKVGDVIVAINGNPVEQVSDVHKAFFQGEPGDTLALSIVRQREALTVDMAIPNSPSKEWTCKSIENGEGRSCIKRNGNAFSFSFSDDEDHE